MDDDSDQPFLNPFNRYIFTPCLGAFNNNVNIYTHPEKKKGCITKVTLIIHKVYAYMYIVYVLYNI